jgi:hypothetical protein
MAATRKSIFITGAAKAAHGTRLHWHLSRDVRLFAAACRLFPFLGRPIMKRMATHAGS